MAIIVLGGYIYSKYRLQSILKNRGKCTSGVVNSELKIGNSYSASIVYYVNNKKYVLVSARSMMIGSKISIIYDSLDPSKASMIDSCVDRKEKLKIDFFDDNW